MAETTRKYSGMAALGVLALCAIAGLSYLGLRPQLQPTPPAPPPPAVAPVISPPRFDVVRVAPNGDVVLAGRAAPGATITAKSGDVVVGTATADAQGSFTILPTKPLPAGSQELSLTETLPNGTVIAGGETASVNVPAGQGPALAVLSGPNGSSVVSGQGPHPGTLGIGTVDYDANGHAIFSGTAPAGARIDLALNGKEIGRATAGQNGTWRFTASVPEGNGTLALSATAANGAMLPPVTAPFALETLPNALAAGHIVITKGENLWLIARHVYGRGTLYTVIYDANAKQIRDPNLIFPGQGFALPKPQG
ncbi:MAG TPA: Ig-like domain-containing protein [Acidocella sp.]|jgi:nucleoid-associated protein YgaU|uniref:Ig-like domain-containing protein n=1 Tax=Acidocella sp. TaxID=50710 RepID=UPI002C27BAE2|nr:Ig-like domain-containing protein [Acidocella sp.]HVE20599.1 Ig-like domain-containing protein [Acidocella sp.]